MLWRDQHGAFNVGSLPVIVTNVAPQLPVIPDVRLAQPSLLLWTGRFTDPGADTWTATVDYGDGSGPEALPLQGRQFTLAQNYSQPGFYRVHVSVQDDDGAVDDTSFMVRIWADGQSQPGDANEDGEFDSGDLIQAFINGKYETGEPADWADGDWDGNGRFESSDLVLAMSTGSYEQGPYRSVAVQHPSASLVDAVFGSDGRTRRRMLLAEDSENPAE
jgi:hypothetical protein